MEFVSHITRAFAVSTRPTRLERAKEATVFMGSAVSGPTASHSPLRPAACLPSRLTVTPRCSLAWP